MTLQERLAEARRRRNIAAHNFQSNTAKLNTLIARLQRRPKLGVYLADKFALRITSTYRTPEHNREVGGVPNSWHTKGRGKTIAQKLRRPAATDLVGSMQAMLDAQAWCRANIPNLEENLIHNAGSGVHLHLGGWAVADWDWPKGGELTRLLKRIRRNKRRRDAAQYMIDALKKLIAEQKPVKAKGLDVSSHQGVVDWVKVKAAGYDFVWVKASEGATFTSPTFLAQVHGARAAGLKVGAYHYLRPQRGRGGHVEAAFFFQHLQSAGLGAGDLIPVLDIEEHHVGGVAAEDEYTKQAYDHLRTLTGRRVGIYTFPFFRTNWPSWVTRAPLWIADFGGLTAPRLPKPWTKYAAWQHTDRGRIDGVGGNVDKNLTADLRKLIA